MLVLIAGATGNLGQKLIDSLISRGHHVRVLARNPSKLDPARLAKLEGVVQSANYYDIAALDRGCAGVDAVICAYYAVPELQLEGNLLLLRAAERAGVRTFVAATWNFDWRNMALGQHESYDAYLAFRNHVELSSDIKPIYIFTAALVEVLFALPGHGYFSPENHGLWDPAAKTLDLWGTGDEVWQWTTEKDAAEFTAAIVEREDASQGGFWSVCSGENTLMEIVALYEKVKGIKVDIRRKGTVEQLREVALEARKQGTRRNYLPYIGYFYQLFALKGTWVMGELDNAKLDVEVTPLEKFLVDNPEL
ncbi:NAD(P)-binding protein [Auricularia subglabra TFB-10046 SS5]|uniref:NAD(P)-binding protein n=1 Tax=Auricularia subglabra (strain TFB-10046 / SS5) TaxID=717982 RepID=J0WX92_AURST|nr:NAD(P)-binding protein [Auricularia subglabra TFB-10046 SS5]